MATGDHQRKIFGLTMRYDRFDEHSLRNVRPEMNICGRGSL